MGPSEFKTSNQRSPMKVSLDDFDIGQLLGRGGFATVYRARYRDSSKEVAIKIIDKQKMQQAKMTERVRNEIRIHSQIHHPAITGMLSLDKSIQNYCFRKILLTWIQRKS